MAAGMQILRPGEREALRLPAAPPFMLFGDLVHTLVNVIVSASSINY